MEGKKKKRETDLPMLLRSYAHMILLTLIYTRSSHLLRRAMSCLHSGSCLQYCDISRSPLQVATQLKADDIPTTHHQVYRRKGVRIDFSARYAT